MSSETIARMTADDKAEWAQVFATCPQWCDGMEHLEGMTVHQGTVGYVSHVSVTVEQKAGEPVGVVLFAEGDRGFLLSADETEQVVDLLRIAQGIVRSGQAQARTDADAR